ncbi:shikimate kinase [Halieaceae bacterium IMCC14734]|uniref:Shikimate kinase n=1 Tax=Candidatus Litorirhabdus singularis TaxID=2518993 RepID=A0ABT3TBR7_9GAMM|nr:shikimate kinase [Candidatus Litorirhabdus singularis]MCX2979723.1 shikimate kinase [Candidatus Litorirhabdus singularis]
MANTISLIGMPGAGKSTVGVLLAKALGLNFVDSDLLLQVQYQASLQEILDCEGHLALRAKEAEVLLNMPVENSLISTGGSAVYSESAMARLRQAGPVVFVDISLATVRQRIDDADSRGIARAPGQDLAAVYAERRPLYHRFATHVIDGNTAAATITVSAILDALHEN